MGADARASVFNRLWALDWICKSLKARNAAKRAVDETMARADAPSEDALVAKAESYLANVPRAEQRWLSVWLRGDGWDCKETPSASKPAKPDRASTKANGNAAPDRAPNASKANGKAAPESPMQARARAAGIVAGALVRDVGDSKDSKHQPWKELGRVYGVTSDGVVVVQWPNETPCYSVDWLEVVEHADPNEPESPAQARARAAGFVVGAMVRDVNRDIRFQGLGEVVGVLPDGHMAVSWPAKDNVDDYQEEGWDDLKVVAAPKHEREASLTTSERAAIAKLERRGFKIGECVRDNISNLPIRGIVVGLGGDGLVEVDWGRKTKKYEPHEVRVVDPRTER